MTTTRPASSSTSRRGKLTLAGISLRDQERGFVAGGTDVGKSTLMYQLAAEFLHRYRAKGARQLILDTKPRYRAEFLPNGMSAKRRYKGWAHGPVWPGSVVVDEPDQLPFAFQRTRTVIAQCDTERDRARLVAIAERFLKDSKASRPQLMHVDETLDFFHGNGAPRGSDVIARASTGGRERGTSALYGAQRTAGLSPALMGMMTRLYALRLDYKQDAKRYQEFGVPVAPKDAPTLVPGLWVPRNEHEFFYWWKGDYHRVWGPFRLDLS